MSAILPHREITPQRPDSLASAMKKAANSLLVSIKRPRHIKGGGTIHKSGQIKSAWQGPQWRPFREQNLETGQPKVTKLCVNHQALRPRHPRRAKDRSCDG